MLIDIYEDILEKIHGRNKLVPGQKTPTEYKDFILLMECLGLTAWRGNGRAGDETAYDEIREIHAARLLKKSDSPTDLKSVIVQTHARNVDGTQGGFEFIHKSFGEFLAARGLVSLALATHRRMSNPDDPQGEKTVAQNWVKIVRDAELTPEIIRFLKRDARRQFKPDVFQDAKQDLERLFSWAMSHGMPAHLENAQNYREIETVQRCAESALLATGTALTSALHNAHNQTDPEHKHLFDVKWQGGALPNLHRLGVTIQRPVFAVLSHISLRNQYLSGADLIGADLRGADLRGANLKSIKFNVWCSVRLWAHAHSRRAALSRFLAHRTGRYGEQSRVRKSV